MRNIRAGFVGFGEVNTPREIIRRKCDEARRLLEAEGVELVWTEPVSDDPAGQGRRPGHGGVGRGGFRFADPVRRRVDPFARRDRRRRSLPAQAHAALGADGLERGRAVRHHGRSGGHDGPAQADAGPGLHVQVRRQPARRARAHRPDHELRPGGSGGGAAASGRGSARWATATCGSTARCYDGVSLRGRIGPEVEFFEMLEMAQAIEQLDPEEVARLSESVRRRWTFVKPPAAGTIESTVRLFLAAAAEGGRAGLRGDLADRRRRREEADGFRPGRGLHALARGGRRLARSPRTTRSARSRS